MTPERWERIKQIFESAHERQPTHRADFVARECLGDEDLQSQVMHLLSQAEVAGDFLEHPFVSARTLTAVFKRRTIFSPEQIVFGRFRIVRILGHGGMGEVYEAFDIELRDWVALKTVRHEIAADPRFIERFKQEVQRSRKISHPNVCRVYDLFRERASGEDDVWFLTMERLQGETLADQLGREGRMDPGAALPLVRQMCGALDAAHRSGVIHRDFKSGNVMLVDDGARVVVTDFGLARSIAGAHDSLSSLNDLGQAIGTPAYMAPEQVEGKPATAGSDIYALGVVIYEMVTGTYPFHAVSPLGVAIQRLTTPPTPPRTHVPGLDPRWEQTILRCLALDPSSRFHSGAEISAALEAAEPEAARGAIRVPAVADHQISNKNFHGRANRTLIPTLVSVLILTVALAAWIVWPSAWPFSDPPRTMPPTTATSRTSFGSLAVLPLLALQDDVESEFRGDQLTEEITVALSGYTELRVAPWSSAAYFTGKNRDAQRHGRQLNVEAVLDGTIEVTVQSARLQVKLLDVLTARPLWTKSYDIEGGNGSLGMRVASDVGGVLGLKPAGEKQPSAVKRYTNDRDLYRLYQEGRRYWNNRDRDSLNKAIELFTKVLEKDSAYALAYAGLADCYYLLGAYNLLPPKEAFPQARNMASRALAIDGTLAEAYTSLAIVKAEYDWDRNGADAAYRRALELNPAYATAHQWYAEFLSGSRRHEEAIHHTQSALELDPDNTRIKSAAAITFYFARRYDDAIAACEKALQSDPNYMLTYFFQGHAYEQKAMYPEAIAAYREGVRRSGGLGKAYLAHAFAISGQHEEAHRIARELTAPSTRAYVSPYEFALLYAGLGDEDQALKWLEEAYKQRSSLMLYLNVDPRFDAFRGNPRFQALTDRLE